MTLVPFTRVDELGCYFDAPEEPNNIHFELHLSGRLDPARLRAAVLAALAAHPLARARRRRWHGWDRRLHWEIADRPDVPPVELVRWTDDAELAERRTRLLDGAPSLDLAPPLRIGHAVGPEWDALIVNIHHAAMDGVSVLRLLRSVARHYTGTPDPVADDPFAIRVPRADRTARPPRSLRPVARIAPDGGTPAPGCGFHLVSLPYHNVHSGSSTVNDVLVAALVLTVDEWNTAHGTESGTVRITLPVNARAAGSERLGNLSRLTVVANEPDRRGTHLLADVTRQTAAAKATPGPQIDLFTALMATPLLPVAVKAKLPALAMKMVGAASETTLLTNLGRVAEPPDFGPASVTGLWVSAPVRMPRGLTVGAATVRDRLHLSFRYRRALFDARAAARFAEMFDAALRSFHDPRFGTGQ